MRRLIRGDVEAANVFVKPERTTSAVGYKARDHRKPDNPAPATTPPKLIIGGNHGSGNREEA